MKKIKEGDIKKLRKIFAKMNKDGFNTEMPLKWGFYFFDSNKSKLEKVFEELKEKSYLMESLILMEDAKWRLHASKIEILEFDKLHRRNIAFNELAEYCDVELYDGWDVEKI